MGRKKIIIVSDIKKSYKKRWLNDNNFKNKKYIFEPHIEKIRKELFSPCQNCPKQVRTLYKVPVQRFTNPDVVVMKNLCDECADGAKLKNKLPNYYCEYCEVMVDRPTRKCDTCDKFVCDITMCWKNLGCVHAKNTHTPALLCHDCLLYCAFCGCRFCKHCFDKKNNKCVDCCNK